MIRVTRLNRQPIVVNADQIALLESTPDTLITLLNGDRVHVLESLDEVMQQVVAYKREILHVPRTSTEHAVDAAD